MTPDHPFRQRTLHILPDDDLSAPAYYLSRSRGPGLLPIKDLGLELFGAPLRPLEMQQEDFGDDVIEIGVGTGGCIQQWTHRGIPLLNHAGWCGRSLPQTFFVTGTGIHSNPTMGGDKFDAYLDGVPLPLTEPMPPNWDVKRFIHGARTLTVERVGNHLSTLGIPLEWDPTGLWFGDNHGGSTTAARELRDLRFGFEIDFHWQRQGIHRVQSLATLWPPVSPELNLKWASLDLFLCFGFDDIQVFKDGEARSILDLELVPELWATVLGWPRSSGVQWGILDVEHGRPANTRQTVDFLLDGPQSVVFRDGPESKRFTVAEPFTSQVGRRLKAPRAVAAEFNDVQSRYGFTNRIAIGGGTGKFHHSDQTGAYPSDLMGSPSALIYVSRPDSPNPWSFNKDVSVALFVPAIDDRHHPAPHQRQFRWASKRERGVTPTHGVRDNPVMLVSYTNQWDKGSPRPNGLISSTAYVCVGTQGEVLENLRYLEAES